MATVQATKTNNAWDQIFPATVANEKQSLKFLKKMVALGVSSIAYLRFNIPDEAFQNVDLEGLNVTILRTESRNEATTEIVQMIRWASEALDKGYLKELIISVNTGNPEDVYEAYSFSFNSSPAQELSQNNPASTTSKRHNFPIDVEKCANDMKNAAKRMIRRIILLTQDLESLPEDAHLDVKLCYNAGITPDDYHARGFSAMDGNRICSFRQSLASLPSLTTGRVATLWHEVSGSIGSKAWPPKTLDFVKQANQSSQLSQYFDDNSSQQNSQQTCSQNSEPMSQDNFWDSQPLRTGTSKLSGQTGSQRSKRATNLQEPGSFRR